MSKNFDIAIIGGSFAGMSAALSCAKISPDIKIAIIEQIDIKNQNRQPDGRGYAISNISLDLFEEIGIKTAATKTAGTIKDIKITDYHSPIFVDFLSKEADEENFGRLIESYQLHNSLRDAVLKQENITLFCPNSYQNIEFSPKKAEITLDNDQKISADLIFACDGRFSKLRERFQIATKTKNYNQKAIVFNIKHQKPHQNIAWEKFLPSGPLAILPLQDQNQSSIVWISEISLSETILDLDAQNFKQQLLKKMQNCLGDVEIISEKFSYPLIMVEASKFYHKNLLFVGDSACGVHPIAGQGLNLGLESIIILKKLIAENFLSGLEINSKTLIEKYNRQAKINAKKMVIATDLLNSLFESDSSTLKIARNIGLSFVNKLPSLKKFFIKNAGGAKN